MMESYRVVITVPDDGTIIIRGLPFTPGEEVELIVRRSESDRGRSIHIPLRAKQVCCVDAAESTVGGRWDPLQ